MMEYQVCWAAAREEMSLRKALGLRGFALGEMALLLSDS
jgi:hypothetical protein